MNVITDKKPYCFEKCDRPEISKKGSNLQLQKIHHGTVESLLEIYFVD